MKIKNVLIGEAKIGSENEYLVAVLGSCVGLAVFYKEKGKFALAHCLLPEKLKNYSEALENQQAKYVSDAFPVLFDLLDVSRAEYNCLEVVVVGGSYFYKNPVGPTKLSVGELNVQEAFKQIKKFNLKLAAQHTGGLDGYKITINCSNGSYETNKIQAAVKAG